MLLARGDAALLGAGLVAEQWSGKGFGRGAGWGSVPEEAVGEGCRGTGPPACPRGRTRRGSRCLRVPPAGYQGAGGGGDGLAGAGGAVAGVKLPAGTRTWGG